MNSFFKSTIGIGNILGLFFGTFLYMYGGYCLPYIVFGFVFLLATPLNFILIPANIEEQAEIEKEKRRLEEEARKSETATSTDNGDMEKNERAS